MTLLAVFAHPDDEVIAAGSLLAQRARGDRVVIVYLTRGEASGALGDLTLQEVAARRTEMAREAAAILDVEHRFLDLPDCGVVATPAAARSVAGIVAELRPDGLVTWGDAWVKGMRHPDHQATGKIARDAVTLARIVSQVAPLEPHRAFCPVFTLRGAHSALPRVVVDVGAHVDRIHALASFYHEAIGFGDRAWLDERLRRAGASAGISHGEAFDAWESEPGLRAALLPTGPSGPLPHPGWGPKRP